MNKVVSIKESISNRASNAFIKGLHLLFQVYNQYSTFNSANYQPQKGDQRYPHLDIAEFISYSPEIDCFLIKDSVLNSKAKLQKLIRRIMRDEIYFYELLVPQIKRINISDILGYKTNATELLKGFFSMSKAYFLNRIRYMLNRDMFGAQVGYNMQSLNDVTPYPLYTTLTNHLESERLPNSLLLSIHGKDNKLFHIGVVTKGNNIASGDHTHDNLRGELFHLMWHLSEGIQGFGGSNKEITETWGKPPQLFVLQAAKGRYERRKRSKPSKRVIQFKETLYLRLWMGKHLLVKSEAGNPFLTFPHGLYDLMSPCLNLISKLLPKGKVNDILIETLFQKDHGEVRTAVENYLGKDSYDKIFQDYGRTIFKRLPDILSLAIANGHKKEETYKLLFSGHSLMSKLMDNKLIALIWLSKEINEDRDMILDLLENYHQQAIASETNKKITIEIWLNKLNVDSPQKAAKLQFAYLRYMDILEEIE